MKKTKQLFASLFLMTLGLGTAQADYTLNLMKGVTKVSNDIYDLHMLILWICVFIGAGVFGVMFYSIYHHRKSKGHQAAQFHENTTVELIWTIIPTLILVAMAIPATKTLLELDEVQDPDMSVKVTGYQWFWEYEYLDDDKNPDNNLRFFSKLDQDSEKVRQLGTGTDPRSVSNYLLNVDKPLVIPVNKKVRFLFTSKDVIHSWWVPDFGWKKDANPGFINEAWTLVTKPGVYRGQCTELCGKDHGFMPVVVIAMEQADYDKWVKDPPAPWKTTEIKTGDKLYAENCTTCHQAKGEGIPGAFPSLAGSQLVKGDKKALAELIVKGKGGMPAFGTRLQSGELANIINFIRKDFNKVDDAINADEIEALLSGKTESKSVETTAKAEEKEVKAESKADKPAKKAEKAADMSKEDLIAEGKTVYEKNCASCHMADGAGLPGTFPALKNSKVVTGDINKQVDVMMSGKGMMPAFGSMLSAEEFAAVVTYTRNDLGNSVGDLIQPAAVKSLQSAKK